MNGAQSDALAARHAAVPNIAPDIELRAASQATDSASVSDRVHRFLALAFVSALMMELTDSRQCRTPFGPNTDGLTRR